MSSIGSPIDTSLVQAAQAQQTASKARDKERAASERTQRYLDQLELKIVGLESAEAIRQLPQNDSEQANDEHEAKGHRHGPEGETGEDRPHIDVTA
jgi:hypothetical protein